MKTLRFCLSFAIIIVQFKRCVLVKVDKKRIQSQIPGYSMASEKVRDSNFLGYETNFWRRAFHFAPEHLWVRSGPDNAVLIPVVFDTSHGDFSNVLLDFIGRAFEEIERKSNYEIRFTQRKDETKYIIYTTAGTSCQTVGSDKLGDPEWRKLPITIELIEPNCTNYASVLHETMHGLGFSHEHCRPDRDNYVKVIWEHIHQDSIDQLEKFGIYGAHDQLPICPNVKTETGITRNQTLSLINSRTFDNCLFGVTKFYYTWSCNLSYDFYSIMHYPEWAFTNSYYCTEIGPCVTLVNITDMGKNDMGQYQAMGRSHTGLTKLDVKKLHCAYRIGEYKYISPPS